MKDETLCIQCHEPLGNGRPDRKFCSENCRINYHNEHKVKVHQEIKHIELALKKNREILRKQFHPTKEKFVSRDELLKAGFEFTFHTHFVVTKTKKNEFTFCFDYGYREVVTGQYKIIKSF